MLKKNRTKIENYFEVFLILSLMGLFLYLISGFLMSIFLAATVVFFVKSPYEKLVNHTQGNRTIPALFIMFLVFTLLFIPLTYLSVGLINQTQEIIYSGSKIVTDLSIGECNYSFCPTVKNNLQFLNLNFDSVLQKIGSYLTNSITFIFTSVSDLIVNLFVFILAFFFLLKDGDAFINYIRKIVPMKESYKEALFYRFKHVSQTVFIDSLFVALIQGLLIGIGFYFVGFKSYIFWGVISAFFSLIPFVGATIIWIPAVIGLIIQESYFAAAGLALYCALIVGTSDNVFRAFLLNKEIQIHPFLVLISVMGGISLFGFFGIFIGPIIVSLLITVIQLYKIDSNKW